MTASAKKLVYTLQAIYEGKGEIAKLQSDLNELKKIEAFQGMQESFAKTNREFVEAKNKMRELRREMNDPGGAAYAESYKKAKIEVEKLASALIVQKQKINESRTALQVAGVSVGKISERYNELQAASQKTAKILAAQAKLGVKPLQDVEREVDGLKRAYKELEASGTMSLRELAAAKGKMNEKIEELRKGTRGWRENLDMVHQGWIGIAGIIATVAATARGITFFAGFDDSMRSVAAVSGATANELSRLTAFAKELGETTRFTATEAAQGMEELAQSGMSVNEIIATLPQALNIAAISGGTIKEAADLVTDTLAQFRLEVGETGRVTDVLVQGYTGASTSLQQLGEGLSYAGPIAASFGYSLEETVAILDALAEAGFKGSRGGTALVGGLTRLVKPAEEAKAILSKYSIQVFDATGKVRNFADILEDVGRAALTPTEMMTLFGQEAGPGMAGLLGQGSDAIRNFIKELKESEGVAARIAGEKEGGIGGALRSLGSSLQAVVLAFGDSWAPMIKVVAEGIAALARLIAGMPDGLKLMVSGITLAIAATASWHLGLGLLTRSLLLAGGQVLGLSAGIPALTASMNVSAIAAGSLSTALRTAALSMGALYAGYKVGEWLLMRKHWEDIAKLTEENSRANAKLADRFAEVSAATGVTVTSMEELDQAVKNGLLHYDDAVGEWVAGAAQMEQAGTKSATAQKQATGEALEDMKRQYQSYADEVMRLQDQISGRTRNLYGELRDLARSGMTDIDAWRDQKAQAEEYMAVAKEAAEAGDFTKALEYADQAKQLFKGLNTEIKDGDRVLVSQQDALKTAMDGVKDAGELGISVLQEQQDAAAKAMDELTKESGFANLKAGMDDAKKKWLDNWQAMRANTINELETVEQRIDKIVKDRTMNVYVNTVQKNRAGGIIGATLMAGGGYYRNAANGFYFPGYGGGDQPKNLVMAEDGEVMIKKESVRAAGLRAALAWNAGNFGVVLDELLARFRPQVLHKQFGGMIGPLLPPLPPAQLLANGGSVGSGEATSTVPIDLTMPTGNTYRVYGNQITAKSMLQDVRRMKRRSSRG